MTPQSAPPDAEPMAIIGMACRFSGEASSVDEFWEMMRNGRTGHGPVPSSRYAASAWYHPSHDHKGSINHDSGFFLQEDPSLFDAPFFSITAKEAAGMDPAQRLLLEVAYETFENGGIPMESVTGSNTAVYSGCMTNDYELLSTRDIFNMPHNSATGNGRTMLANRISWFFDLRGPSIMLDTACSSSLTALHLAFQALRGGECNMALVTGASLILHPNFTQRLNYMHMLSRDGISHSFDEKANGYGRGEGIGAILIKPLSAALADGDSIRAVVRATGANQDGRTPGITMPSAGSQADLMRTIYGSSGASSMLDTSYFEAHGTGTPAGDPTELSAIGETLGAARKEGGEPLYVGSVKSNIGHTEGAAGVASLIKVALCLENRTLVPTAGFETINPKVRLEEWKLRLTPNTAIPWPDDLPQRASINSFGFGGSNAHVILESKHEYLRHLPNGDIAKSFSGPQLIVFSTHDKAGIDRLADKWSQSLPKQLDIRDIAHTMAARRSQLGFRSFAVADSPTELQSKLQTGLPSYARAGRHGQHNLLFIFTGQGAQWAEMGRELLQVPIFAESLARTQSTLTQVQCPWDIVDEICAPLTTSRIHQPDRSQPICCALQIALVDLMASWGVHPKATVGHSSGEIAAAYAAGYLSQDSAMRIAYFRGIYSLQVVQQGRKGGMLATGISSDDAQKYIDELLVRSDDAVAVVACINSPASTTLSGDLDLINQLEEGLHQDKHFARKLRVDIAYHSPHMNAMAEEYAQSMGNIKTEDRHQGKVAMFSSVTTEQLKPTDITADYWVRNMICPVRFAGAVSQISTLSESKTRRRSVPVKWSAFVEFGPHSALKGPVMQTFQSMGGNLASLPYYAPVLRKEDAVRTALQLAGSLWSIGYAIDLGAVNDAIVSGGSGKGGIPKPRLLNNLPSYPWNHQTSFWHSPIESTALKQRQVPRHDLLGVPMDFQNDLAPRWRHSLRVSENPWIADHLVAGSILYPAAGTITMALEAALQLSDTTKTLSAIEFQDLQFLRGVVVPKDEGLDTMLEVTPHPAMSGWYKFSVFSLPGISWVENAKGMFSIRYLDSAQTEDSVSWDQIVKSIRAAQPAGNSPKIESVYQWLYEVGNVTLGPAFQCLTGVSFKGRELFATAVAPDSKRSMPHEYQSPNFIHPTVLDSLFQAAVLATSDELSNNNANIPVEVDRLVLPSGFRPQIGDLLAVHAITHTNSDGEVWSECHASDPSWSCPGIVVQGVRLGQVPVAHMTSEGNDAEERKYSSIVWDQHLETSVWIKDKGLTDRYAPLALKDVIKSLCHTIGNARTLVMVNDTSSNWIEWLESVAPHSPKSRGSRLFHLDISLSGTELHIERTSASVHKRLPGSTTISLPPLQDLSRASFGDEYDLIILKDHAIWDLENPQDILSTIISTLNPDGHIALHVPTPKIEAVQQMIGPSSSHALDIQNVEGDFLLARRAPPLPCLDPDIYLLTLDTSHVPRRLLDRIQEAFSDVASTVHVVGLDRVADLAGKTVISMVEFQRPWVSQWTSQDMERFQALLRAKYILWISQQSDGGSVKSAEFDATAGLLRTVRNENPDLTLVHVRFAWEDHANSLGLVNGIMQAMQATLNDTQDARLPDLEFSIQNGKLLVPRVMATPAVDEVMQTILHGPRPRLGSFRSNERPLQFRPDASNPGKSYWDEDASLAGALAEDHVEIELDAITTSDANSHTEMYPEAKIVGREGLGIVRQIGSAVQEFAVGDEVVVVTRTPSPITTQLRAHQSMVIKRPSQMTRLQAVSAPFAYTLAYHTLFRVARLGPGSSLLVVGPLSQVMQATIECSLASGSKEIYVAIGGPVAAQDQIRSEFRSIQQNVFGVSGNLSSIISSRTGGKGVDVAICSQGGYPGRIAASCLGRGGSYIDLSGGQLNPGILPSRFTHRGCSFVSVSPNQLPLGESEKGLKPLHRQALDLILQNKSPVLKPYSSFPVTQLTDALQQSRQEGTRVVIDLKFPGQVSIMPPAIKKINPLDPRSTYILAGGLGTIGLAFAETLVDLGARHLLFLGRSGTVHDETQKQALVQLQDRGCRTETFQCDISKENDVQRMLLYAWDHEWHIKGVVQCTTVLKDSMFNKMTFDSWSGSTESKIQGTLNLHHALPLDLDFFVTLSSIASVIGNMGQANYSAGNALMDGLMVWRQNHGLPGHSINIGLVPDASGRGDVLESPEERRRRYGHLEGTEVMKHELQTLLRVIIEDTVPVPPQVIAGMTESLSRDGATAPWKLDRRFDHRIRLSSAGQDGSPGVQTSGLMKRAESIADATRIVNDAMREYLALAMATTADGIDPDLPLSALGVDSLKATEVQNWVSREMGAELSSFDFLGSQPLKALAEKIAASSSFVKG